MKKMLAALLCLAMLTAWTALAEENAVALDFPRTGYSLNLPKDPYGSLLGQLTGASDGGDQMGTGLLNSYVLYTALTDEEWENLNALMDGAGEELSEEADAALQGYYDRTVQLFEIYGLDAGRDIEDFIAQEMGGSDVFSHKVPLGEKNDHSYWLVTYDTTQPQLAEYFKDWPGEMMDEYLRLADDLAAHPEYFALTRREQAPALLEPGSKVSFETTDLEGNAVTAAELFAGNKVTMVNIWATWCGPCLSELDKLDEINRDVSERGGAILAFCTDADNEATIATARDLVGAYSYRTLLSNDSITRAFLWNAVPTSYFVDSEGVVLDETVVGAFPDRYRETFDRLLAEADAAAAEDQAAEDTATYTLKVVDEAGRGVPQVYVNFCTDALCDLTQTDENGVITYEGAPQVYHLQVIKVPEGYAFDADEEIYTEAGSQSLTITLTAAE